MPTMTKQPKTEGKGIKIPSKDKIRPEFHCALCAYPISDMVQWASCPLHSKYFDEAIYAEQQLKTPIGKKIMNWFNKSLLKK